MQWRSRRVPASMNVLAVRSDYRSLSRVVPAARFLAVGLSGMAVNELVYVGLAERLAIWFVLAAILATEFSSTWNFVGNERWAFSGRQRADLSQADDPVLPHHDPRGGCQHAHL